MPWLEEIGVQVNKFFAALHILTAQEKDVLAIATIVVGSLFCFFGCRFFKYVLGLGGFLIGGLIGLASANYWFAHWPEIGKYVLAAVVGAVGAVLFYFLFYYVGVFVFGATASMWVALLTIPKVVGYQRPLIVLGIGFTGGLLALLLRKPLVILCTAAVGAIGILAGIGYFYNWPVSVTKLSMTESIDGSLIEAILLDPNGVLSISLLILFFIAGLFVQLYISKPNNERR